jgi:hypothetical protein
VSKSGGAMTIGDELGTNASESRLDDELEALDRTPPPDHEGWVEAGSNGRRATRERLERRRRKE